MNLAAQHRPHSNHGNRCSNDNNVAHYVEHAATRPTTSTLNDKGGQGVYVVSAD